MTCKVYMGSRPLSFNEYTEFTHSPPEQCNQYQVNHEKYELLGELQKIEAVEDINIEGPCSQNYDMSVVYKCIKHKCILPCVCKDCVLDEKQCPKHQMLHPGYFDPKRHAITVRNDDSHDNTLGPNHFDFNVERRLEVIKYAGIENDDINCKECPKDLLHHQAYHFIHHERCKFCHICKRLCLSKLKKDTHVRTQHGNELNVGAKCDECDRLFQSRVALEYHKNVVHMHDDEKLSCNVCQKTFKTEHNIKVHVRSVHNRRSFHCKKCLFRFKLNSYILRHYKTVHNLDLQTYDSERFFYTCTFCDFKTVYKQI